MNYEKTLHNEYKRVTLNLLAADHGHQLPSYPASQASLYFQLLPGRWLTEKTARPVMSHGSSQYPVG